MPAFGIVAATVLASVLTVVSYTSFDEVFTTVVLLSVLTSVIPYLFSAAAQVYWLATSAHHSHPLHLARDLTVGLLALVFSFWSLQGSGQQAVYYGVFAVLLGVPVYVWHKSRKGEYGEVDTICSSRGLGPMTTSAQATRPRRSVSIPRSAGSARSSCTGPVSSSTGSPQATRRRCCSTT